MQKTNVGCRDGENLLLVVEPDIYYPSLKPFVDIVAGESLRSVVESLCKKTGTVIRVEALMKASGSQSGSDPVKRLHTPAPLVGEGRAIQLFFIVSSSRIPAALVAPFGLMPHESFFNNCCHNDAKKKCL